ncbi:unnamed protein product, partial [Trichogramma brassicae]
MAALQPAHSQSRPARLCIAHTDITKHSQKQSHQQIPLEREVLAARSRGNTQTRSAALD